MNITRFCDAYDEKILKNPSGHFKTSVVNDARHDYMRVCALSLSIFRRPCTHGQYQKNQGKIREEGGREE